MFDTTFDEGQQAISREALRQDAIYISATAGEVNGEHQVVKKLDQPQVTTDHTAQIEGQFASDTLLTNIVTTQASLNMEQIASSRSKLLNKKYTEGLTDPENRELQNLTWRIELVDYTESAAEIANAQQRLVEAEKFSSEVDRLIDALRDY